MRRVLAVAIALGFAACANPQNENVSREGPTTTTTTEPDSTEVKAPVEVGRWNGSEDTDTENITVKETWELHWRLGAGDYGIGVTWTEPGDGLPADMLTVKSPEGSSLIREGGTFYLSISSYGSTTWEIWVVDVPN